MAMLAALATAVDFGFFFSVGVVVETVKWASGHTEDAATVVGQQTHQSPVWGSSAYSEELPPGGSQLCAQLLTTCSSNDMAVCSAAHAAGNDEYEANDSDQEDCLQLYDWSKAPNPWTGIAFMNPAFDPAQQELASLDSWDNDEGEGAFEDDSDRVAGHLSSEAACAQGAEHLGCTTCSSWLNPAFEIADLGVGLPVDDSMSTSSQCLQDSSESCLKDSHSDDADVSCLLTEHALADHAFGQHLHTGALFSNPAFEARQEDCDAQDSWPGSARSLVTAEDDHQCGAEPAAVASCGLFCATSMDKQDGHHCRVQLDVRLTSCAVQPPMLPADPLQPSDASCMAVPQPPPARTYLVRQPVAGLLTHGLQLNVNTYIDNIQDAHPEA